MEGFYKAKEARQVLGVTEDKFQYMVRTDQVKKVIFPGRTYGMYPRQEIDDLANALNGFVNQYNDDRKKEIFRAARPEDAKDMYELGESIMTRSGGHGIPPEKLIPFLAIPNSEIGHVLIRDKKLAGYFTIVPLTDEQAQQKMLNEVGITQMKIEDLPRFEPEQPVNCFIWEVMSDPEGKHTSAYLIGKLLTFFHTLGKRGVEIKSIYAVASSPEGINICRRTGMQLMNIPSVKPNYMPFELKVNEHKNWLTRNYLQAVRSYKLKQARLKGVKP